MIILVLLQYVLMNTQKYTIVKTCHNIVPDTELCARTESGRLIFHTLRKIELLYYSAQTKV